ncbi:MAG: nucleotidyl transferase AbiEii/AbiGii toxin family protein [Firmicutes bacterium]|nr:nucleotidyl transferase AbiEii/AbiGii toxin family protein [Bacillota bacterium]
MMQFDRISLGRQAKELGFVRDTFEKVCRLTDVLSFMESDKLLSESLALKGGTAINLTVFDLPRLSVDIDLDYSRNVSMETMLQEREQIKSRIQKYMVASGYILSSKSKQYHALDSFVYEYINAGETRDNLKIEINYMLRCHVFPTSRRTVRLPWNENELNVLSVDPIELFSAKVVALFNRSAARDLYDIFNLQKYRLFDESQEELFKKCIIFYFAIASETVPEHFDFDKIERISAQKIRTDLVPVLKKAEHFNLSEAEKQVGEYLKGILLPEGDLSFWTEFANGEYKPELLFDDTEMLARVERHPMAVWKCRKKTQK